MKRSKFTPSKISAILKEFDAGIIINICIFIISICILFYGVKELGSWIVNKIQNPPSEIYAENQTLNKWDTFCIDGESEDGCDLSGYRLKTKSTIFNMKEVPVNIISVIEVDENYEELSITLRDWKTGKIIEPYPQEKHKWYQFPNKKYNTFETAAILFDEDGNDIISYEVTLKRDEIIISEASCDSRGFEENNNNIKGGCFFLEDYEKNINNWHYLSIVLKDNRKVLIEL